MSFDKLFCCRSFAYFHHCQYVPHVRKCLPKSDGLSTVGNLLGDPVLRFCVWIVAIFTLLGNILVLVGRLFLREGNKAHMLTIGNLCGKRNILFPNLNGNNNSFTINLKSIHDYLYGNLFIPILHVQIRLPKETESFLGIFTLFMSFRFCFSFVFFPSKGMKVSVIIYETLRTNHAIFPFSGRFVDGSLSCDYCLS